MLRVLWNGMGLTSVRGFGSRYRRRTSPGRRKGKGKGRIVTPEVPDTDFYRIAQNLKLKENRNQPLISLFSPELLALPNVQIQGKRWVRRKVVGDEMRSKETALILVKKLKEPKDSEKQEEKSKAETEKEIKAKPKTKYKKKMAIGYNITYKLIPQSPKLGPFEIDNAKVTKSYYWCSCGLSSEQPFCNGMHFGTKFKPLKFRLAEEQKRFFLCGCKLTTMAPFCDGSTCIAFKKELKNAVDPLQLTVEEQVSKDQKEEVPKQQDESVKEEKDSDDEIKS